MLVDLGGKGLQATSLKLNQTTKLQLLICGIITLLTLFHFIFNVCSAWLSLSSDLLGFLECQKILWSKWEPHAARILGFIYLSFLLF